MHWTRKLARPLALQDGTTLVTLREAAEAIDRYFSTTTKSKPLEATIESLMEAAKSGKRADIAEATDILERMLQWRQVLKG